MKRSTNYAEQKRRHVAKVKPQLKAIFRKYGAKNPRVFGSVANGDAKVGSDVDILIDGHKKMGLMGFVRMQLELEKLLDAPVDIVDSRHIKQNRQSYILGSKMMPI
jgi:predicted nucleotidyltransferase